MSEVKPQYRFTVRAETLEKGVNATVFFTLSTEGGNTVVHEHTNEEGAMGIRALVLPENMVRHNIRGFMAEGREISIKPPDESFTEGKLEAQGQHLEDLRKLLKLADGRTPR